MLVMSYSEYKRRYGKDAYNFWKFDHRMSGMYGGKRKFPQRRVQTKRVFRRDFTPRTRNVVMIQPRQRGYLRRSGFYGRFTGPSGEAKFFDTDIDDATVSTTMTINNLTIIPEGNGESDRIGRKVNIKAVHIKGTLTLPTTPTAANTSAVVKFMLIQDKQTNGAQYTATDLLDTDSIESFNNLANSARFRVLKTVYYNLKCPAGSGRGTTDTLSYGEDVRWVSCNMRINIPMEYDNSATTGAIGTVRTNNLYWVSQASASTANFTGTARIRYTDR